jgi:hypothetical protein
MENKYYTPTIKEFYIGFEFEKNEPQSLGDFYDRIRKDVWKPFIVRDMYDMPDRPSMKYISSWFRVKYLDREDVESLDFVLDQKVKGEYFFIHGNMITGDYSLVTMDFREVEIYSNAGTSNDVRFKGSIKNKSELKKILEQLKIVKNETNSEN